MLHILHNNNLVVAQIGWRAIDTVQQTFVNISTGELIDGTIWRSNVDVIEGDVRAGGIATRCQRYRFYRSGPFTTHLLHST